MPTEPRLTAYGTIPIVRRGRGEALKTRNGAVAQLGERRVRNAKVRGSIPLGSTNPPIRSRYPALATVIYDRGRVQGLPDGCHQGLAAVRFFDEREILVPHP